MYQNIINRLRQIAINNEQFEIDNDNIDIDNEQIDINRWIDNKDIEIDKLLAIKVQVRMYNINAKSFLYQSQFSKGKKKP